MRVTSGARDPAVLHVSSETGWRGGERQVLLLAVGAVAHGLDHAVAAPVGSELAARARSEGLEVVPLPSRRPWRPSAMLRILRWLRRRNRPVLHAHTSPALDAAPLLRLIVPLGGVVYTRRTCYPIRSTRKYRTGADRYVAVARCVADQLAAAGANPGRVTVIPSGADLAAIDAAPAADPLGLVGGGPAVGCVGALAPEKGQAVLLAAWREVLAVFPNARLVLVGEGLERRRLEQLARELSPGSVRFAGFRDDVASCLKSFDLVVLPSIAEGIGGAAIEAMACRRAVVASRVGGLPEVVADGVTGLTVPSCNPAALSAAIVALLGDAQRRAAMGEAGRVRVEAELTVEGMVAAYLNVYRELAWGDHRPGRHLTRPGRGVAGT